MKRILIESPGKIIISGEHSAVYGYPAIVVAVSQKLSLTFKYEDDHNFDFFLNLLKQFEKIDVATLIKKIKQKFGRNSLKIVSTIPVGRGMGSSAALAAAISMLILELSKKRYLKSDINRFAFKLEKISHKNPSGIDNTTVIYGGLRRFFKLPDGKMTSSKINGQNFLDRLFLIDTGRPKETTSEMVIKVKKYFQANPQQSMSAMSSIGETTTKIQNMLEKGGSEMEFMKLICANQRLLESLGVVGERSYEFIRSIEKAGGAAKVSGAGGYLTVSGMVLVYLPESINLFNLLKINNYQICPLIISSGILIQSTYV